MNVFFLNPRHSVPTPYKFLLSRLKHAGRSWQRGRLGPHSHPSHGCHGLNVQTGQMAEHPLSDCLPLRRRDPGGRLGLRILRIGDASVSNIYDYMAATRNNRSGDEVKVVVSRDGKEVTLKVILAAAN